MKVYWTRLLDALFPNTGRYSSVPAAAREKLLKQASVTLASASAEDRPFIEADILELQGRSRAAIETLTSVMPRLAGDATRAAALVHRGRLYRAIGEKDRSLRDYREAAGLGSDNYVYAVTGEIALLCELGSLGEARALTIRLVEALPRQRDANVVVVIENAVRRFSDAVRASGDDEAADEILREASARTPVVP